MLVKLVGKHHAGSIIAATRLNTAYDLRLPIGAADVSALIAPICQDPEKIEAHSGTVMAVRTKDGIDLRTTVGSFSLPTAPIVNSPCS